MTFPCLNDFTIGPAEQVLASWPGQLVDLVVTSPPYWNLRDYGEAGQIGLEATPEAYVDRLARVFRALRRVLKDTGSVYLNLGDTYRDKGLVGIPGMVGARLAREGYRVRNLIVWHKPNSLPCSARDRFQSSYEFVYFLIKDSAKSYFFDLDAVRVAPRWPKMQHRLQPRPTPRNMRLGPVHGGHFPPHPLGKNPGDVWGIHPENRPKRVIVPGAVGHFAPFPEALCVRPILASCPPGGIVLDPFVGSGTVPVVARRLGRNFLGIDISPRFIDLARRRLDLLLISHSSRVTADQVQKGYSGSLSLSSFDAEAA
jgi:site-specific DNA-methyltransferase (adenine-specific)